MDSSKRLLEGILSSSTVLDVVKGQKLISAAGDADLISVIGELAKHHVSSIPVVDEQGDCIGLIDFSDVVAFLLKMDWAANGWLKDSNKIWRDLESVPVSETVDLSGRNAKVEIDASASLKDALVRFKTYSIRRAVVVDPEDGTLLAVLSPSAITRFVMHQLRGRNDATLSATVGDLKVGHGPVQCVKKSQTVLEAMHLMFVSQYSVVAVLDPKGALIGSMSMSDIKTMFEEKQFSFLVKPCWNYILDTREKSDTEVFPFFGVSENDKLQIVISKLLATNVHHLYVVDSAQHPLKVISFSDVCSLMHREIGDS